VLHSRTLVILTTLALGAAAATADAATLSVPGACLPSNEILPVAGAGFSPNSSVNVTGAATSVTGFTDATGSFSTTFLTPNNQTFNPKPVVLTGTDEVNPAVTATAQFQVVRFGSNLPLTGKPGARTTWKFAGFVVNGVPGTVYGHFRFGGKTIRNYRFGKAQGVCGALTARARRLPAKSRPGQWRVQIDMRKSYSAATRPRVTATFTIRRTFF
jgi:hypothetical protein